jgi:hypothetical protein
MCVIEIGRRCGNSKDTFVKICQDIGGVDRRLEADITKQPRADAIALDGAPTTATPSLTRKGEFWPGLYLENPLPHGSMSPLVDRRVGFNDDSSLYDRAMLS